MSERLKIAFSGYELTVNYSPGIEARTYGPPENCWPAEGPEIEVLEGTLEGRELTPAECAEREESGEAYDQMVEAASDVLHADADAHADRLYDELRDEGLL